MFRPKGWISMEPIYIPKNLIYPSSAGRTGKEEFKRCLINKRRRNVTEKSRNKKNGMPNVIQRYHVDLSSTSLVFQSFFCLALFLLLSVTYLCLLLIFSLDIWALLGRFTSHASPTSSNALIT